MNNTFEIKLVSPKVWGPIINSAFDELSPELARKARAILRTLHNRHIGITPALAAGLAPLIAGPYGFRWGPGVGEVWDHVIRRLQDEASGRQQTFGVLLSAHPLYSILRLVMPLVEEACPRIGLCCLFCADNIGSDVTMDDYNRYSRDLGEEIKRMADTRDDGDDYFKLSWTDRAITLAAYSSRASLREGTENSLRSLPETGPAALGLLLRLKTTIPRARPLSFQPRPMSQPLKHREVRRIKEGGFSGIYVTRRQEDIGDILLSEFTNPLPVLADRLINNGFLALHRQARREKLRDFLVVGLMPAEVQPGLSVDFIKACWLDFISRFGMMAMRDQRVRSEFRWLEGDRFGGVRGCHFLLQDMPAGFTGPAVEGDWQPVFRREFLTALGWLPQYLDTRAGFGPVFKQGTAGDLESAQKWAFAAWRAQKENPPWKSYEADNPVPGGPEVKSPDSEDFTFVHLMLFLPAGKRREGGISTSGAARLGALYSGFGTGGTPRRSIGVTWVPGRINASGEWAFDCRGKHDSLLFPQVKPGENADGHYIASRLVQTWRDYLLKELRNG